MLFVLNVLDGVTDHKIRTLRLYCQTTTIMTDNNDQNCVYTQADILNAILDLKNCQYASIRSAAKAYCIPFTTLRNRMSGHNLNTCCIAPTQPNSFVCWRKDIIKMDYTSDT